METGAENSFVGAGALLESKTSHLDDVLNERLWEAFHHHSFDVRTSEVAKIACEYSPIDLGYAASRLPTSARHIVYENLPDLEAKVEFFINTDGPTRAAVFRHMGQDEVQELIEKTPAAEAVWVLDDLPERRLRRLMERLGCEQREAIKELQSHGRRSAGRLMTNEFFAFSMDVSLGEAAKYIREHPGIDLNRSVFVLNREGQLQGHVPASSSR